MANALKQLLESGGPALNGWLNIESSFSAELMAQGGYDSLTLDLQHGAFDYADMLHCLQALRGTPVTPMVRVAWNEPATIGRALDAGAMGVIAPMIGNAEQARRMVHHCKYPPLGGRSNGPMRAGLYATNGLYQDTANDETLCIPLIETGEGMVNAGSILDVDGVAGVYVGPSDLRLSVGKPVQMDRSDPDFKPFMKMFETLVRECESRGKFAGMHTSHHADGVFYVNMGFKLVTISSDSASLLNAAKATVTQFRSAFA
jgi:4-hydroxy-2-oxoheptanedioate aldolase